MPVFSRNVTTDWDGGLMDGNGVAKAGSGAISLPGTFANRVGEAGVETSPAELREGAHAACFAMALNGALGKKGAKAKKTHVTATVSADKSDSGIKIVSSTLTVLVEGWEG